MNHGLSCTGVLSSEALLWKGQQDLAQMVPLRPTRKEEEASRAAADSLEGDPSLAVPSWWRLWPLLDVELRLPESTFLVLSVGFGGEKLMFP